MTGEQAAEEPTVVGLDLAALYLAFLFLFVAFFFFFFLFRVFLRRRSAALLRLPALLSPLLLCKILPPSSSPERLPLFFPERFSLSSPPLSLDLPLFSPSPLQSSLLTPLKPRVSEVEEPVNGTQVQQIGLCVEANIVSSPRKKGIFMETAVLLPQDCFQPYKRRHKYQIYGMIYRPESAARARRNTLQGPVVKNVSNASYSEQVGRRKIASSGLLVKDSDAGILPLPFHSSSMPINMPSKDNELKKGKSKRLQSPSDVPTYTILQRPKPKETNNNAPVITILQRPKYTDVDREIGRPRNSIGHSNGSDSDDAMAIHDVSQSKDGFKHPNIYAVKNEKRSRPPKQFKPLNVVKPNERQGVQYEMSSVEAKKSAVRQEFVPNEVSNVGRKMKGGKAILQRYSSMDSEAMNSVLNHYQIPSDSCKLNQDKAANVETKVISKERWAGPAYTASPSPSSLPLPKFSLPISRVPSPGLGEVEFSKHVHSEASLSSSLPSFKTEAWDAAIATQSLRRMLNLDPM